MFKIEKDLKHSMDFATRNIWFKLVSNFAVLKLSYINLLFLCDESLRWLTNASCSAVAPFGSLTYVIKFFYYSSITFVPRFCDYSEICLLLVVNSNKYLSYVVEPYHI